MRLLAAALALLFAACAPSTPESRIQANPRAFASLSETQQSLVRQGKIEEGMPPEAVFIAWGRPNRDYTGADRGTPTRVWEYAGAQPVYSNRVYGGYGYGYPYRSYGRYGFYGVAPDITYIPYRKASVWFRDDRVTKWERAQ